MRKTLVYRFFSPFILSSILAGFAPVLMAQQKAAEPLDLLSNATWSYKTYLAERFSAAPPTVRAETSQTIQARAAFTIEDLSAFEFLELTHGLDLDFPMRFHLNGNQIQGPLKGMLYRTIPAIPASMLQEGKNNVEAEVTVANWTLSRGPAQDFTLAMKMSLKALKAEHLRFQTGPILGAFSEDSFTVTCRTNFPATVSLDQEKMANDTRGNAGKVKKDPIALSSSGLFHRFKILRSAIEEKDPLFLRAHFGDSHCSLTFQAPTLPGKQFHFAALGDSRSLPENWARVSHGVFRSNPALNVFLGDMVTHGRDDWLWDNQFFKPAGPLFTACPFYPVIGNHDENAPLYDKLFFTPTRDGRGRNWSQVIGPVLLIGIDGLDNWSLGSRNVRWLDRLLAESREKFIFLFNHYPAWTSGPHGRLDSIGRPVEQGVRWSREIIYPLLEKYDATAMIASHDHFYERTEPPSGVTHIVSGGAGAPLYMKTRISAEQNPYSEVFAFTLHFCLFTVNGSTCKMEIFTPEGHLIDTRSWRERIPL